MALSFNIRGKFANGALSAAFVHLFNAEAKDKINIALERLEKAYKFYKGLDSLGEKTKAAKALYEMQQALASKNLNKALDAYMQFYDLIPDEFKLFPIKPEAILGTATLIEKKQIEKLMWVDNLCNHDINCVKHFYHPPK